MEFIDLKKQLNVLKPTLLPKIISTIEEGNYIMGPQVEEFEHNLASYLQIEHVISCANGTDALILAMQALNLKAGEVVLVPSFTFAASAEAIALLGGIPFFIDVSEDTYNVNLNSIEEGYQNALIQGLKPVGIMTVDLFGLTCEYDLINNFCKINKIWHIIDAAQACGAKYKERFNCSYADITTTSFFPAKPLGCYGDGGAIFTDSVQYAEKIKSLRVHGKGIDKYDNIYIGMNSRLDTIQATILKEKLIIYNQEIVQRNKVANFYNEFFSTISTLQVPNYISKPYHCVWAQYTIKLKKRDELQTYLKNLGIPSMVYYPKPLHLQTAYNHFPKSNVMNNTELLSKQVLSLPMHPYLTIMELEQICNSIRKFFEPSN
ncbi:DegT/DnrJ/EryC1/StrS family aminotransferase [Candidatus Tisiphia endosymbiont of Nemotelus uliginosus]|uniref:DegT/DnrJ/EryC1/StrS family aminotransferase n=1 Tax=Candidatus Tisiphia endosymbiont of Nemotelus uliginosus TaxID=3077926 RepID=UPI0035C8B213